MKIQNINFKKVFIVFFAAFLIFTIASVSVEVANGRWKDAVDFEQHRFETNGGRARFGDRARFGGREREGRFGHSNRRHSNIETEISIEQLEVADERITPTRGLGDSVLYRAARTYVRVTAAEFDALSILGWLLHAAFITILALWVYVDSRKQCEKLEHQTILWVGFTLFFHLFGLVLYLIVRESKRFFKMTQPLVDR